MSKRKKRKQPIEEAMEHPMSVAHSLVAQEVMTSEELLRQHLMDSYKVAVKKKKVSPKTALKPDLQTEPHVCPHCPNTYKTRKYMLRHIKVVHMKQNRKHKCSYCDKTFQFPSKLRDHEMVHTGEKPLKCDVCGKCFRSAYSFASHQMIHTDEKPYKCAFCDYSCRDNSTIRKHQLRHLGQKPKKTYKCDQCSQTYTNQAKLDQHQLREHLPLPYTCDLCGKGLKNKLTLKTHLKSHQMSLKIKLQVTCPVCKKIISNKGNLKAHMLYHSQKRPFKCKIKSCKSKFKTKMDLVKHELIHDADRRYICDLCKRRFVRKSRLVRHVMLHYREKNVRCEICDVSFYKTTYLLNHLKVVHLKQSSYRCDHCDFVTNIKPSLIGHVKAHAHDHDRKCTICHQTFKEYVYLKLHYIRKHKITYQPERFRKIKMETKIKEEPIFEIKDESNVLENEEKSDNIDNTSISDERKLRRSKNSRNASKLVQYSQSTSEILVNRQKASQLVDNSRSSSKLKKNSRKASEFEENIQRASRLVENIQNASKLETNSRNLSKLPENVQNALKRGFKISNKKQKSNSLEEQRRYMERFRKEYNRRILNAHRKAQNDAKDKNKIPKFIIKNVNNSISEDDNKNCDIKDKSDNLLQNTFKITNANEVENEYLIEDIKSDEIVIENDQFITTINNEIQVEEPKIVKIVNDLSQEQPVIENNQNDKCFHHNDIGTVSQNDKARLEHEIQDDNKNIQAINRDYNVSKDSHENDEVSHNDKTTLALNNGHSIETVGVTKDDDKVNNSQGKHQTSENESNLELNEQRNEETAKVINDNHKIGELCHNDEPSLKHSTEDVDKKYITNHNDIFINVNDHRSEGHNTSIDVNTEGNEKNVQVINLEDKTANVINDNHQNVEISKHDQSNLEFSKDENDKTDNVINEKDKLIDVINDNHQNIKISEYDQSNLEFNQDNNDIKDEVIDQDDKTVNEINDNQQNANISQHDKSNFEPNQDDNDQKEEVTNHDDNDNKEEITNHDDKTVNVINEAAGNDEVSDHDTKISKNRNNKVNFNTHQCYVCFKLFQTKPELLEHCREHFALCSQRRLKKCPLCDYVCVNSIKRHILLKHKINVEILNNLKEKNGKYHVDLIDKNSSNQDLTELEIIPSIKHLNKQKYVEIDAKRRKRDRGLIKSCLVKRGNEWVVESKKRNVDYMKYVLPVGDDDDVSDEDDKTQSVNDTLSFKNHNKYSTNDINSGNDDAHSSNANTNTNKDTNEPMNYAENDKSHSKNDKKSKIDKQNANINSTYLKDINALAKAAKNEGLKILYPCDLCEQICSNLAALTAHRGSHDVNLKLARRQKRRNEKEAKKLGLNGNITKSNAKSTKNKKSGAKPAKSGTKIEKFGTKGTKNNGKTTISNIKNNKNSKKPKKKTRKNTSNARKSSLKSKITKSGQSSTKLNENKPKNQSLKEFFKQHCQDMTDADFDEFEEIFEVVDKIDVSQTDVLKKELGFSLD